MKQGKQTVGDRVRILRQHYKLSQSTFANAIGLKSYQAISNVENGHNQPEDDSLSAIVSTYGTTRAWLLHGEGEMLPNGMLDLAKSSAQATDPWKDTAFTVLRDENKRLWEMVNKFMNGELTFLHRVEEAA